MDNRNLEVVSPVYRPIDAGKNSVKFRGNYENYLNFAAWAKWYPDLFLDLMKPEVGGITLCSDQRTFMRAIFRFYSVYGVFPRGFGKCVTAETMLYTDGGIKEIGEYFNYLQQEDEEWLAGDDSKIINRYGKPENLSSLYFGGHKPTKRITTEYGYSIETTLNHPLLIMKKDGNVDWVKAENITIDDYVVINRNNGIFGEKIDIDKTKELEDWVTGMSKGSSWKIKNFKTPKKMDKDIAYLIGALVGDGCLKFEGFATFSNVDEDIVSLVNKTLIKHFGG